MHSPSISGVQQRGGFADGGWLRPFTDEFAVDELLQRVNPLWSLRQIRCRIVAVRDETADTRTLLLKPNRRWAGFAAGQFVQVEVEVDGRRLQRCYSLSSAPGAAHLAITVKRQSDGKVSPHLHESARVGDVLTISAAQGEFVLPQPVPPRLLMIAAGSGITPMRAMLESLAAQHYRGDIVLRYVCRTRADFIFERALDELATRLPGLRVLPWFTAEQGRPDLDELLAPVPDYAERHTLLCGPSSLIDSVRALWLQRGIGWRLQFERFGFASPTGKADAGASTVHATDSGVAFDARAGVPLLGEAEAAGLHPAYGCRMGICHSCKCRKRSGTVENLVTGEISSERDEMIQLCISAARTPLELDL